MVYCFYLFIVCLCDRVENIAFEEDQAQDYEEEHQYFTEEGKWISPSA